MSSTIMTVDLEYDWEQTETEAMKTVVPKLLDFFDDNDITATFFIVGSMLEPFEDIFRDIGRKHELASHSHTHRRMNAMTDKNIIFELEESKKAIESLGVQCIGFRSPLFMMHPRLGEHLMRTGYAYDSSAASFFFPWRYNYIFAEKRPYVLHRDGGNEVIELPNPGFTPLGIPYGLSYYRLFYPLTKQAIPNGGYSMFYMHPFEFLDNPPGEEISIFVRHLFRRNHGTRAWSIFEELVSRADCRFCTCEEYLRTEFIK